MIKNSKEAKDKSELEIYFSDLNEDGQKKVLKFYGVKSPYDANWDICPLAVLVRE